MALLAGFATAALLASLQVGLVGVQRDGLPIDLPIPALQFPATRDPSLAHPRAAKKGALRRTQREDPGSQWSRAN